MNEGSWSCQNSFQPQAVVQHQRCLSARTRATQSSRMARLLGSNVIPAALARTTSQSHGDANRRGSLA